MEWQLRLRLGTKGVPRDTVLLARAEERKFLMRGSGGSGGCQLQLSSPPFIGGAGPWTGGSKRVGRHVTLELDRGCK
jgi:hypothetical protein